MDYSYTKVFYSKLTKQKISEFYGEESEELQNAIEGDKSLPGKIQDDIIEEKAHLNDLVSDPRFSNSLKCLVDKKPISVEDSEFIRDAIASIDAIKTLSDVYENAVTDRALQRQMETESRRREKREK